MEFLKEKKGIIISFIIGVILASSITVYATSYFAKDITYKDGKTVEYALNDLYTKIGTGKGVKDTLYISSNDVGDSYNYVCNFEPSFVLVYMQHNNSAWVYYNSTNYAISFPGSCVQYNNLITVNSNGFSWDTKTYGFTSGYYTIYAVE